MAALLDTSTFLWIVSDSSRLSSKAENFIADFDNELILSAVSLWEIAIKTSIGKLELFKPFNRLIPEQLEENAIQVLPLELDHFSSIIDLEFHHRDPFDRLIIAQSITENIPVITSDSKFQKYPVEIIW